MIISGAKFGKFRKAPEIAVNVYQRCILFHDSLQMFEGSGEWFKVRFVKKIHRTNYIIRLVIHPLSGVSVLIDGDMTVFRIHKNQAKLDLM